MPFLTYEKFEEVVGADRARLLTSTPGSFESARDAADSFITQITGVAVPAEAASSPPWAIEASATIVDCLRVPFMPGVSTDEKKEARERLNLTFDTLKLQKVDAPSGEQGPTTGELEGMATW